MNAPDSPLQDYVDGRMSADERTAFERRLERDPELAERLAQCLSVREALRKEEPLPAGFYARARAEFEERHGSSKRGAATERSTRAGWRWVSWEALGLAAAAGLALALFVPALIRDELPLARPVDQVAQSSEARADAGAVSVGEPAASLGDMDAAKNKGLAVEPAARPLEESEERAKTAPSADSKVQGPQVQRGRDERSVTPTTEAGRRDDAGGTADPAPGAAAGTSDEAEPRHVFAPSPPAAPAQAGARTTPETAELLGDSLQRTQLEGSLSERERATSVRAAPLTAGSVPPHAVRFVTEVQARALLAAPRKSVTGLSKDAEEDRDHAAKRTSPTERVVLIGIRDVPFSCDGVRVETSTGEYVVILAGAGPGRAVAEGGCAVYLPADGRAVVVVGPGESP